MKDAKVTTTVIKAHEKLRKPLHTVYDDWFKAGKTAMLEELEAEIKWRVEANRKLPETPYGTGCLDTAESILSIIRAKKEGLK